MSADSLSELDRYCAVRAELDSAALEAWEELNSRPARELPGLAALFGRPSPFAE